MDVLPYEMRTLVADFVVELHDMNAIHSFALVDRFGAAYVLRWREYIADKCTQQVVGRQLVFKDMLELLRFRLHSALPNGLKHGYSWEIRFREEFPSSPYMMEESYWQFGCRRRSTKWKEAKSGVLAKTHCRWTNDERVGVWMTKVYEQVQSVVYEVYQEHSKCVLQLKAVTPKPAIRCKHVFRKWGRIKAEWTEWLCLADDYWEDED